MLALSQQITLACLWEVSAPKAGNVHRGADFDDLTFDQFLLSAVAVGPVLAQAGERGVGPVVLEAVRATRKLVGTNTNLGTLLLLAPLAAVRSGEPLEAGIPRVLGSLGPDDARAVYRAIREAQPGGLGEVEQMDVHQAPPEDLCAAMQLAAHRDLVARQYVNGFHEVLQVALPRLVAARQRGMKLPEAIVLTQIQLLADFPDSLIARKCGPGVAEETALRAARVRDAGPAGSAEFLDALADFDFWLRSDGHRRNPGTTADLIAAALLAALREYPDFENLCLTSV
jgi:triphosphoribosyl-dephospho-CoA synthase